MGERSPTTYYLEMYMAVKMYRDFSGSIQEEWVDPKLFDQYKRTGWGTSKSSLYTEDKSNDSKDICDNDDGKYTLPEGGSYYKLDGGSHGKVRLTENDEVINLEKPEIDFSEKDTEFLRKEAKKIGYRSYHLAKEETLIKVLKEYYDNQD